MELRESLASGLDSLRAHRLRSFLTMLGMVFGVGAVIAMLSIGAGAERQALALIDALGVRNVIVRAQEPTREADLLEVRKSSVGLGERDARAIALAVPEVERVAQKAVVEAYKVLGRAGRSRPQVLGVSAGYADMMHLRLAEGRFFDEEDLGTMAQVCVIGSALRRELFAFEAALGQPVKVNERWLTVVGVLDAPPAGATEVEGVRLASTANDLYLPVTTAQRKFDQPPLKSALDELVVEVRPGASARLTAGAVDALLGQLHGGARDYVLVVPEELLEQSQRTRRLFDLVMGCIAGISLLVGGIGIMNIMLATVLERTSEIGLRRASGATRRDVRNQFLVEAFTISAGGGALGIAMGVAIAAAVGAYAGWSTVVTPWSILLASGVSLAVGVASGLYPAQRAARMDPIDALRHE